MKRPPSEFCTFDRLCDVPVHWGKWGRTGWRHLKIGFCQQLELALTDLFASWQWGTPLAILSGGAYPGRAPHDPNNRHWQGGAFDLSGFQFPHPSGTWQWELWHRWEANPRQALAVEAILRKHLPQVLGPWYNRAHQDHWHVDDANVGGFQTRSPCDVRFVQACVNYFPGAAIATDGKWGPETAREVERLLEQIDQPAVLTSPTVWGAFLEAVWRWGFGRVEVIA